MAKPATPDLELVTVTSRADLRAWLAANHTRDSGAWLVTFKKHTAHYLPFEEAVEELLCWGWIDSRTRGIDADRTSVLIAPRNPKSAWSAVNKAHVARARASGAMTPAGDAKIAAAMENGMWAFLDDVERLERPADLQAALDAAGLLADLGKLAAQRQARHAGMDQDREDRADPRKAYRRRDRLGRAGAAAQPVPPLAQPLRVPALLHGVEIGQRLAALRAETPARRVPGNPVDAEHAEIVAGFAPGEKRPDLAPEAKPERAHHPVCARAFGILIGDFKPLAGLCGGFQRVDPRARVGIRARRRKSHAPAPLLPGCAPLRAAPR
jgi:uncharacterized protein YdeI (YjbR/CyaY-like superfamily)